MSKQIQKRAASLLILSIMILSFLPSVLPSIQIATVQAALSTPQVWNKAATANLTTSTTVGTTLTVNGTGVTAGTTVNVYWDSVGAWDPEDGTGLLNTTKGNKKGNYDCWIVVPDAEYGDHYVWIKDTESGDTVRSRTIDITTDLELDPEAGIKGDEITVTGTGFYGDSDIEINFGNSAVGWIVNMTTSPTNVKTDDLGTFDCEIKVPGYAYGNYNVSGIDWAEGIMANATLRIGATIELSEEEEFTAGMIVTVEGRGFNKTGLDIAPGGVTIGKPGGTVGIHNITVRHKDIGENISIGSKGTFKGDIVIPAVPTGKNYVLTVSDTWTFAIVDDIEVIGTSEIIVDPMYGTPGQSVTVKGYNFTQIKSTKINLNLSGSTWTAKTDDKGEWTKTIVLPALGLGAKYPLNAWDEYKCNGTENVLITLITIQLSEDTAPVGSAITLSGTGMNNTNNNGQWNATLGDLTLFETTDIAAGINYFSQVFYVPSVPAGTYRVMVYDVLAEIEVYEFFEVTDPAELTLSTDEAPPGYNLTIDGLNFAEVAGVETEWNLYNSTWSKDIVPMYSNAAVETTSGGNFTAWLKIPWEIELGTYTINCTTVPPAPQHNMANQTAEVTINIVEEAVDISIRKTTYALMDTITFTIKATFAKNGLMMGIKDPGGYEIFNSTWIWPPKGTNWAASPWKTIGDWTYLPVSAQIDDVNALPYEIPSDATPGAWTWIVWDENQTYGSGTFTVTEKTDIEVLQENIAALDTALDAISDETSDLKDDIAGVKTDVEGVKGDISAAKAAADAAKAAADSAKSAVSDVASKADSAKSAADAAKTAADAAKTAADDAKSAASGLNQLVWGAIIASIIAALVGIFSLMQISRRIAG